MYVPGRQCTVFIKPIQWSNASSRNVENQRTVAKRPTPPMSWHCWHKEAQAFNRSIKFYWFIDLLAFTIYCQYLT